MPGVLTFPLSAEAVAALPRDPGRALHGVFYRWLELGDPALTATIHARVNHENAPPPFTIALLREKDAAPYLRATVLDDALWPALLAGIAQTPALEVLDQPVALPPEGPELQRVTYARLADAAGMALRVRLRFLSPTAFRSREMHVPLPDPLLAYQSWLARWNAFAPEPLRINAALLDVAAVHVAVAHYRLRTVTTALGEERRMVGFVGVVDYALLRSGKLGGEWVRSLNLLADYAAYCGTGHRTAQGMGQTRRVERAAPVS